MTNTNLDITGKLKQFKLSGIARSLDLRTQQAKDDNLSYCQFLNLLLEDEANQRSDNRQKRLYQQARLPFEKGIEDFDFSFQPSIKKQEI